MWGRVRSYGCLKLGPQNALWAESTSGWLGRHRNRCLVHRLPPGLIRPSPVEPNIQDPVELTRHLRKLTHAHPARKRGSFPFGIRIRRPAVLVLPDLSVRSVILRLENLPAAREEQAALVRWRLGQEQLFPLAGTKVMFHSLGGNESRTAGPQTVLAVAIRESVLTQFEEVCTTIGLIPTEVDIATFRLFNLWSRATGWLKKRTKDDLMWVSFLDGGMTVLVFQAGQLVFLRSKLLTGAVSTQIPPDRDENTVQEILSSLAVCAEAHPNLSVSRLLVASEEPEDTLLSLMRQQLDVQVEELGWKQAARAGWKLGAKDTPLAGLSAVAGLLGG